MREKIKNFPLYSRYGYNNFITEDTPGTFILTLDENCGDYLRVIGNPGEEIEAIDPSGGPFISVGEEIGKYVFTGYGQLKDKKIKRIYFDKEIKKWKIEAE